MTKEIVLALDAMGGDQAPTMVVRGANIARVRHPNVRFLLFGDEQALKPLLRRYAKLAHVAEIRHTTDVIGANDKPALAIRKGRQSSMRLAIDAVDAGEAHGVVSAGNTGALMVLARLVLKTLPGIDRPAMGSIFPTQRGESVILDLGANLECSAAELVQFAVMGEVFARTVLGVTRPSVGLLNVGSEELKGGETLRQAAATLRESGLPLNFQGFIEGDDIAAGTVDVVVTDGFTGNVALKTAEGTARLYTEFLKAAFKRSILARIAYLLAQPALRKLRERVDPRAHNGAMFLGLNGVTVKSHGGTDHKGFANALDVAIDMLSQGVNPKIIEELAKPGLQGLQELRRAAL
ncbi:MAG: phosphate acyltransferase PlsX [Alphaproteobacteria bacterium]|nr:phosphate acyltransferase PlsX [Alphaproteobacteria bacterium]